MKRIAYSTLALFALSTIAFSAPPTPCWKVTGHNWNTGDYTNCAGNFGGGVGVSKKPKKCEHEPREKNN